MLSTRVLAITFLTVLIVPSIVAPFSLINSKSAAQSNAQGNSIYIDPNLKIEMGDTAPTSTLDCWFMFRSTIAMNDWMALHPEITGKTYTSINAIFFSAFPETISMLISEDGGKYIQSAWAEHAISTDDGSATATENLLGSSGSAGISHDFLNMTEFRDETGLDGRNVIVGLLSTGIGMNPDLVSNYNETTVYNETTKMYSETTGQRSSLKIIANVSFVDWDPLYLDVNGMGTFLAGIIGGTGNSSKEYTGVAPEVQLINAKCVDLTGITLWNWAVSAMEFCFEHGADIIVAGFSIIGYPGDPLTTEVQSITDRGVVVVADNGEIGPSYMTTETPAMAPTSIAAGIVDTTGTNLVPANISSRGPSIELVSKPDLLAPGINVTSDATNLNISSYTSGENLPVNVTQSFGTPLASNANYTTANSSAAAAAFVGGVCALLMEEYQFATPAVIKDALLRTAVNIGADANTQGTGIINASGAYQYLASQEAPITENRSFSPVSGPYAGFVPTYEVSPTVNRTSLWFVSSYGTLNYFAHIVQNKTSIPAGEGNVTDLIQGMFGLYQDGSFGFLLLSSVLREMHLTNFGNYSRGVGIIQDGNLLIVITAETWEASMYTMRLRFDIINIGNTVVTDLGIGTWMKADIGFDGNVADLGKFNVGGYNASSDMLYVNGTPDSPAKSSYFMFMASQHSNGHAVGCLTSTINWIQNSSMNFKNAAGGDSIDNVTLAAKYNLTSSLAPGQCVSINFSFGRGFDFQSTEQATNYTLAGYPEPVIQDLTVAEDWIDRDYQVGDHVSTGALVINAGNTPVNQTELVFSTTQTIGNYTQASVQTWNLGIFRPLEYLNYTTTWVPQSEGMYSCSWVVGDQQDIEYLLINGGQLASNPSTVSSLESFNPSSITVQDLASYNGSLGGLIGLSGDTDPLTNLLVRDVFVYNISRMYNDYDTTAADQGWPTPRPYAGITPHTPLSAPMTPDYIGQYAYYNLTVYTSVPLTGFTFTVSGNASVLFISGLNSIPTGGTVGYGSVPSNVTSGTAISLFLDETLATFPAPGDYVGTINFTSDQGFIDSIPINYTVQLPQAKIFFDTQHNDFTSIETGSERNMLIGSYYQFYEDMKVNNFDVDEYINFQTYSQMVVSGTSLLDFYDAIIIPNPQVAFSNSDLSILLNYYDEGGKIIILANANGSYSQNPNASSSLTSATSLTSSTDLMGDLGTLDNFNLGDVNALLSGAPVGPDTCNLQSLSQLTSLFGIGFNESYNGSSAIKDINSSIPWMSSMAGSSLYMNSYTTMYFLGNTSGDSVIAWDANGDPVAVIHQSVHGGEVVVVGDSDMIEANDIGLANNSQFITTIMSHVLQYKLAMKLKVSSTTIHLGDPLYLQATITSNNPGLNYSSLFGVIAFEQFAQPKEGVLFEFLQTKNNSFASFIYTRGLTLGTFTFPVFNYTGQYYVDVMFHSANATGVWQSIEITVLPAVQPPPPVYPPTPPVLIQGIIVLTVSMAVVVAVYFNARRKQERSMFVPELDDRTVRNIDNLLMELQSKLTVVSENILFQKKSDDYKVRLQTILDKIKLFQKTVKKVKNFKKKIS